MRLTFADFAFNLPPRESYFRRALRRDPAARDGRNETTLGRGFESVVNVTALDARINAALDEVRPGILRDGGDVWLVRIEEPVAYVMMVGACGGCAMATATLKGAIETAVRARCPEIERVEQM